jgi:atypical dual specificity phosphatase
VKLFPRTPHLAWSGHVGRDDLQLTEEESLIFVARMTVVQEKLDGANVSIRVSAGRVVLENRGKPISAHPQFDRFKAWAATRDVGSLGDLVLYGEWLFATHGTAYDVLPDYFIAYDVYDPSRGFLASTMVRQVSAGLGVVAVSDLLFASDRAGLLRLASDRSSFGRGPREGVYCRIEEDGVCVGRAKLVRPGYAPRSDAAWRQGIVRNHLAAAT